MCLPFAVGGCARSGDGTVVIPERLDMRRFWDKGPQPDEMRPSYEGATVFPVPPQATRPASPARTDKRRPKPRKPARERAEQVTPPASADPLTCGGATTAGVRVRVMCQ
ncbi:hypothetical protein [Mesorhizobium sp. SP-1A]|uniref:hypothetical protein n=1 Tax=Mesorhizobium sp. SP-1A TaxID=3077840 RepID=UPI0028F71B5B|nr:hypothetical protein [Mesorhizobium sp. SP-1A]